jgi:hypothetical protein
MKILQLYRYSDGLPISHTLVDDQDYHHLNQWTWSFHNGHAQRREGEETIFLFDVVAERAGLLDIGTDIGARKTISHFIRDPLDNRRANLRPISSPDNGERLPHHRVEGVSWNNTAQKWKAEPEINGVKTLLGHYSRLDQANSLVAQAKANSVPEIRGVGRCRRDGKWYAQINVDGSEWFLGYFDTKDKAFTARRKAEKKRAEKEKKDYADQSVYQAASGHWFATSNLDGKSWKRGYYGTPEGALTAKKEYEKEHEAEKKFLEEDKHIGFDFYTDQWYVQNDEGIVTEYFDTKEEAIVYREERKEIKTATVNNIGKFHTKVEIDGKEVFLGYFDTVAEAVTARRDAENPPKCVYFDAEKGEWYVFIVDVCGWGTSTEYFDTPGEADTARHMAMKARDENRAARDAKKARNADNDDFLEKVTKKFREDRHKAMTDLPDGTGFDSCRGWYARHKIDGVGYFFGYYTTWDEAIAVVRAVGLIPDSDDPKTEPKTQIVGDMGLQKGKP